MAPAVILVVMVVAMAAQMIMENKALSDAATARNEAARRQNEELMRQRKRENEVTQAKKSDAARKADRELASSLTILGETGGGAGAIGRAAGEVGGILGLDIARIEGNRNENNQARRSQGVAIIADAKAFQKQAKSKAIGNIFGFIGDTAGAVAGSGLGGASTAAPTGSKIGASTFGPPTRLQASGASGFQSSTFDP